MLKTKKPPYLVEGDAGTKRYIIIDDLVASGKTARVIQEAMKDFAPKAVCLGVLEVAKLQYGGKDVGHYSKSYHAQHKAMPLTSVTEVSKERKWEDSYEHCIFLPPYSRGQAQTSM